MLSDDGLRVEGKRERKRKEQTREFGTLRGKSASEIERNWAPKCIHITCIYSPPLGSYSDEQIPIHHPSVLSAHNPLTLSFILILHSLLPIIPNNILPSSRPTAIIPSLTASYSEVNHPRTSSSFSLHTAHSTSTPLFIPEYRPLDHPS